MKPELPDISQLRGMGDPLFFSFNLEPKSNVLISHAVVFSTLILPPTFKMKLAEESDDPRFPHFTRFLLENEIIKGAKAIEELDKMLARSKSELASLQAKIEKAKRETV